jgi:hypothetical protein
MVEAPPDARERVLERGSVRRDAAVGDRVPYQVDAIRLHHGGDGGDVQRVQLGILDEEHERIDREGLAQPAHVAVEVAVVLASGTFFFPRQGAW